MSRRGSIRVALRINGRPHAIDVAPATTLLDLLRSQLGLTGTKDGCGSGDCGACTVLVDDEPILSCLVLAAELSGRRVVTIETRNDARVERLREAFLDAAAFQCGYCTPGMIMAASRLPANADRKAIRAALAGNLCRCTGYTKIVRAIERAGRRAKRDASK
ncbi:MAG: (2Fe-2S)-binding protein [Gemmatimonadales bacterium]